MARVDNLDQESPATVTALREMLGYPAVEAGLAQLVVVGAAAQTAREASEAAQLAVETVAEDFGSLGDALAAANAATQAAAVSQAAAEVSAAASAASAVAADGLVGPLNARMDAVESGQVAGHIGFATKALMDAGLGYVANTLALVTNDPVPANNISYIKLGASGAGSWQASADRVSALSVRVTDVETAVAGITPFGEVVTDIAGGVAPALPAAPVQYRKVVIDGITYALPLFEWVEPYTMLLMVSGQSNAARRLPGKYTTSYDSRLQTFVGGVETTDRLDGQSVTGPFPTGWFNSLVPFSEVGKDGESLAPGFATVMPAQAASIITATPAIGARHWRELMDASGSWTNKINALRYGKAFAVAAGATVLRNVMLLDHGESDADNIAPGGSAGDGSITVAQYVSILTQWVSKAKRDVKLAQVNPAADITVIGSQPCSPSNEAFRNMQNAHVQAALTVPGYNLAGPRYAYLYDTDGTHVQSLGKRLMGEYLGRRYLDVVAGRTLPVLITSSARAGAVVTLNYNTIVGDLVIDVAAVPETTTSYPNSKFGFECFKVSDGTVLAISTVTVTGKAVTITLTADPGSAVKVRYAQQQWPGGNQAVTGSVSKLARGNIRDSGSHIATANGSTLYNWACHQSVEVA